MKSQFGWHIIKVEDKRSKAPPPFEQVKDQVETFVQRKAQAEYVTKLREGAKVERLDKPAEVKPADSNATAVASRRALPINVMAGLVPAIPLMRSPVVRNRDSGIALRSGPG